MANPMIYGLIQQAMKKIGAIGKDSTATNVSGKAMYKFRGIDAVYNALNPVMAELGLFICPEIIDQVREERETEKTVNGQVVRSALKYTVLTIKYTLFAPDGSNISMTVVGEGMDSGDKSANKAMSVALKYACFQLFMIPTEDMVDPDGEVHDNVLPKNNRQEEPGNQFTPPPAAQGTVNKVGNVPPPAPPQNPPQNEPEPPKPEPTEVQLFLLKAMKELREERKITVKQNNALFADQKNALVAAGLAPNKALEKYTLPEAEALIDAMYKNFPPKSAEMIKK